MTEIHEPKNRRTRAALLATIGIGAAAGFALVAAAVARRKTAPVDHKLHEQTAVEPGSPVRDAAEAVAPVGKWWTYVPAATLAGGYVFGRGAKERDLRARAAGTVAIIGAACTAALVNKRFDDLLPQPPAPPGRPSPDHPVFPSGHAFGTLTVALASAYVISREQLAPSAVVFPVAFAIPLTSSIARLMEEKHWISDIAGGYLAAITLASLSVAAYEAVS
ncbi:MAG: phosphatase PAP2 family protein [Acidobacteriota bacterium]|nr:phosphatase PAP2 family protein [Acidobacteriota bacterium]